MRLDAGQGRRQEPHRPVNTQHIISNATDNPANGLARRIAGVT
jgi:hypothetical protein